MRIEEFDYDLPPDRIAQTPARPRDHSRLMVLDRHTGKMDHLRFHQFPTLLQPGDLLVINETKVLPMRLHAEKLPGGGRAEILLLERMDPRTWETLVGGSGLKPGKRVRIAGEIEAEILADLGEGKRMVQFAEPIDAHLLAWGEVPLPPYIHTPLERVEDYQTIFAQYPGSAAAPTAGFHFTKDLLKQIKEEGILIATITLHIGLDTFAPVREEDPQNHPIHSEWCEVPPVTIQALKTTRLNGGRIIAVGTSVVRTLETLANKSKSAGELKPFKGSTDLFILPGFKFKIIDAMVTNFHLPRSTLLMLVSAFAGRRQILNAYQSAKEMDYRFYSFGDAMFIR